MKTWKSDGLGPYEDRRSKIRTLDSIECKKEKGNSDNGKRTVFRS